MVHLLTSSIRLMANPYVSGYTTFYPNSTSYDLGGSPQSWAIIPALRHAMTLYPHSTFFFALSPHALIMNPSLSLQSHITSPTRLESLLLKDKPVVPPDSVIKTFGHLQGSGIDLVITQDKEGLCLGSLILRRGSWAQYFLDTWFDPLYRSYNFQKAESHAMVLSLLPYMLLLLTHRTGTHNPMAPHHPRQNSSDPPTYVEFIRYRYLKQGRQRSHVSRRRFRR